MIILHNFYIPQLDRTRTIRVYLPPSYTTKNRYYSVIYMHDGQNLFDTNTAYSRPWFIDRIIDKMPIKTQTIVIGIDNGGDDRLKEYAPFNNKNHIGQGNDYLKFIVETLKPFIDQHYRTLASPEHTLMVGSSMGGLITYHAGVKYPTVFGKIGVFSPSIWFNPKVLDQRPSKTIVNTSFYVVGSKKESRDMEITLQQIYWSLKKTGVSDSNLKVIVRDRGQHSEAFWAREFKKMYLEWTK
jgi:predicted alpha/beta superfamily hydrolase